MECRIQADEEAGCSLWDSQNGLLERWLPNTKTPPRVICRLEYLYGEKDTNWSSSYLN